MASRKNVVRPYTRSEQVQTTLTKPEREQLDERASAEVVSRADLIRRLILEGLKPEATNLRYQMAEASRVDEYQRELRELRELQRRNRS